MATHMYNTIFQYVAQARKVLESLVDLFVKGNSIYISDLVLVDIVRVSLNLLSLYMYSGVQEQSVRFQPSLQTNAEHLAPALPALPGRKASGRICDQAVPTGHTGLARPALQVEIRAWEDGQTPGTV